MTATLDLAPTPTDDAPDAQPRRRAHLTKLVGTTVALAAVLAVLLAIFILPSLKSGPRDLPVGVVGSEQQSAQVVDALGTAAPDAFSVERLDSEEVLAQAVRDRELVGGFVVGPEGVRAVVASAGGAAIAQSVQAAADGVASVMGVSVSTQDVVPLPPADPAGLGIGGLAFPLVFGGIVPVVAFRTAFARSSTWKLVGLLTFSVVGGLVVSAVLRFGFGSIESGFLPVAAAMSLGIAAMAFPLTGLQEAFGGKGFTIGAMTMMFLGNPFAGIATTAAWLPAGLGAFGQILPPGATGTLVRSVAYFGGSGGLTAGLTLAAWVVVGLAVHQVAVRRAARSAAAQAPEPAAA